MAKVIPVDKVAQQAPAYVPSHDEQRAVQQVLKDFLKGKTVMNKSYNQFNGMQLKEVLDDAQKRWMGFVPALNPLVDQDTSRIFLNVTRKLIISFLSKLAMQPPKSDIVAVNKKTGMQSQKFADILEGLNTFSNNEENQSAKFRDIAINATTKGTAIVYEGYLRTTQKKKVPVDYDMETGQAKWETREVVTFDNCMQENIPVEDFYIMNASQPDIQKQPKIVWRKVTSYEEGEIEFGHYPNWEFVKPGQHMMANDEATFFKNQLKLDIDKDDVEILRDYNKRENRLIVVVSGVCLYDGPIPFKDGKYPFVKYIVEPYETDFFWGMPFPIKVMGEQDGINTQFNLMFMKQIHSLLPQILSSDADALVEDDRLELDKVRQVSDVEKWKFFQTPSLDAGEQAFFQTTLNFLKDNSGLDTGVGSSSPKGGKLSKGQIMMLQQQALEALGFSISYLEDAEQERTLLRIDHILQFYSIPKVEKITGKNGKEIEQLAFRDIRLSNQKMSDNTNGQKIIKLVDTADIKTPAKRQKLADELSVTEAMGEVKGIPTEALAIDVQTFYDYNYSVQVIKNSSHEKNQALDKAMRRDYANWRLSLAQVAPVDAVELVKWVDESEDIDSERFQPKNTPMGAQNQNPQMQAQAAEQAKYGQNQSGILQNQNQKPNQQDAFSKPF